MQEALDQFLLRHITHAPVAKVVAEFLALGVGVSFFLTRWISRLPFEKSFWGPATCPHCDARIAWYDQIPILSFCWLRGCCRCCRAAIPRQLLGIEICTPLLFASLTVTMLHWGGQSNTDSGSIDWIHYRVLYHLTLVTLLIAATAIDLDYYIIPDEITIPGMIIGVVGATWGSNLQLVPVWIDWNNLYLVIEGAYIPAWIKEHGHLHGLAWSLAGLITGAGITWIVRATGRLLLGVEAMGFGDVTLMAMIGSFLGWQPVIFAFLLAPLCGMILGPVLQFTVGRIAIPFGPYLSAGAILVLFTWKHLWEPSRSIFGHAPSLALLAGCSLGGLVGLLALLRLYRAIPIPTRHNSEKSVNHDSTPPTT